MSEKQLSFSIAIDGISSENQELAKLELQLKAIKKERAELIKQASSPGHIASTEELQKLAAYNKEIGVQDAALKSLKRVVDSASDSLARKKALLIELTEKSNKATAAIAAGMAPAINKLNQEIKNGEQARGVFTRDVGHYGEAIKGVGLKLLAFAGIGVGFDGAMKFIKGSFDSTHESAEKLKIITEGVKEGFGAIQRMVATMDFTNFMKNVKAAYEEGRRYAEGLEAVDIKTRALRIKEAEGKTELLIQRNLQNTAKSQELRNAAGQKAIQIEEDLAKIRTGIASQAFQNEIDNLVQITKLNVDEVFGLIAGKDAMIKNIAAGKDYNDMLKERDKLQIITLQGIKLTDEQSKRYRELNDIIPKVSEETKRFAFAQANLPGDEKLNLMVSKYAELHSAMDSNLESTLRIRS